MDFSCPWCFIYGHHLMCFVCPVDFSHDFTLSGQVCWVPTADDQKETTDPNNWPLPPSWNCLHISSCYSFDLDPMGWFFSSYDALCDLNLRYSTSLHWLILCEWICLVHTLCVYYVHSVHVYRFVYWVVDWPSSCQITPPSSQPIVLFASRIWCLYWFDIYIP